MKWLLGVVSVLIIIAAVAVFVIPAKAPTTQERPPIDSIDLSMGSTATSYTYTGEALGSWYFEATFPVELLNASGTTIAQAPAHAQGDWMTEGYVPFSVTLNFPAQPPGSKGRVIFKNDNPSGDPARDRSLYVPVVFK